MGIWVMAPIDLASTTGYRTLIRERLADGHAYPIYHYMVKIVDKKAR